MARNLQVYPKITLVGSLWEITLKVDDLAAGQTRFVTTEAAGITAIEPTVLLKLVFGLIVGDADADQDVYDALYVDDIRPGPQTETVWSNWRDRAEASWLSGRDNRSSQDTTKTRNDARRALVTQRGWTVPAGSVHQHEADGSVTEE
jgi:hypothetical protein